MKKYLKSIVIIILASLLAGCIDIPDGSNSNNERTQPPKGMIELISADEKSVTVKLSNVKGQPLRYEILEFRIFYNDNSLYEQQAPNISQFGCELPPGCSVKHTIPFDYIDYDKDPKLIGKVSLDGAAAKPFSIPLQVI